MSAIGPKGCLDLCDTLASVGTDRFLWGTLDLVRKAATPCASFWCTVQSLPRPNSYYDTAQTASSAAEQQLLHDKLETSLG